MNKVNNKNRGCGNKKGPPKENGAQIKKAEPPETIATTKDIEQLKNKIKITTNGLVNGLNDESMSETSVKTKEKKNGTETSGKVKKNQKINHIKNDNHLEQLDTDNIDQLSRLSDNSSSDKRKSENCNETVSDSKVLKSELNEENLKPCSSMLDTNMDAQPSTSTAEPPKTTKKSKSKKRNSQKDMLDPSEDMNSPDFDITSLIRNKYKDEDAKAEQEDQKQLKQVVNNLENLEVKDMEKLEEEPWVENPVIEYVEYKSELQMPLIMKIIQKDLSEPYSIYTYRYFIHNWPNLCFLAMSDDLCVGAIVCKLDMHRKVIKRGYIAMLAVDKRYRKHGIGSTLVIKAIEEMISGDADEVVLETEITNKPALRLYEALGFVRDKRLFRYYLNGVDALRLKLWLR